VGARNEPGHGVAAVWLQPRHLWPLIGPGPRRLEQGGGAQQPRVAHMRRNQLQPDRQAPRPQGSVTAGLPDRLNGKV
jgi:hypothetical protein